LQKYKQREGERRRERLWLMMGFLQAAVDAFAKP